MHTNRKGFDERSLSTRNVIRKLERHVLRKCNVVFKAAMVRRCSEKFNVRTKIVAPAFAKFALPAGHAWLQGYAVSYLQLLDILTDSDDRARALVPEDKIAVDNKVTDFAMLVIMYVRSADAYVFKFNEHLLFFRLGHRNFADFHLLQAGHKCCAIVQQKRLHLALLFQFISPRCEESGQCGDRQKCHIRQGSWC
ncbi:hypothetical protein D3C77_408530 [compost metagenome]